MSYRLSKRSRRELIGVHPKLAYIVTEAILVTKQDFMVFDGLRTAKEQRKNVARGVSKTFDSYHLYGLAVDLVAYVDGKPTWEGIYYPAIAKAMKKTAKLHNVKGIDWGYDLWNFDKAHFQMTGMKPYYDYRKLK